MLGDQPELRGTLKTANSASVALEMLAAYAVIVNVAQAMVMGSVSVSVLLVFCAALMGTTYQQQPLPAVLVG